MGAGGDVAGEWLGWGRCPRQVSRSQGGGGQGERAELVRPHSSPQLTTLNSLHMSGEECGMGRSPPIPPCVLFPLASDSYLYFCLYPYNFSFAGMCLEMVPFGLILSETWYGVSICSSKGFSGSRKMSYILILYFFIDSRLVLHSGRASQIHMQVIDLVFCSVNFCFLSPQEWILILLLQTLFSFKTSLSPRSCLQVRFVP